ncbi:hypothetical protein TTHERM_00787340 (macronuclear) [Tetrahymena thermophila SB210]|uniref:Uncharacterized protein n=1 Tax=Tetrahymena thermophila (strain SB210) TaxID=312017 RepID=Q23ZC9_TETTS|nr:hypothetical protein TTHERM_00787340 [Tetrahymena thermophila SB210]EAS01928.1 hypothetical protein TTHERM_00787340 [Tetrahymena thermophila SB210]|eukprot:XP_001022173.1 hypothetical protein TTHERM_00787340 [Tetrahymena thermophila SB210]
MVGSSLTNKNQVHLQPNIICRLQNRNNAPPPRLSSDELNRLLIQLWKTNRLRAFDDNLSTELRRSLLQQYYKRTSWAYSLLSDDERAYAQKMAFKVMSAWLYIKTEYILDYTENYVRYQVGQRKLLLKNVQNIAVNIKAA